MVKKIDKCRICGNTNLVRVLDLGEQMLTGVFPRGKYADVTKGPLSLVKCYGVCGLLQLEHSYDPTEMYGENYGYRSGLNSSMVAHLRRKIIKIFDKFKIFPGEIVVDIGSNDGTTLNAYPPDLIRIGYDPAGHKFSQHYPEGAALVTDFFSAASFEYCWPNKKAKVITCFSMFYDLENPVAFMRELYEVLADDGILVIEQSYMPSMLKTNSYDTICHEHIEFYALKQIKWMADQIGFVIRDVEFNDINGGSISVTLSKTGWTSSDVPKILDEEDARGSLPLLEFVDRIAKSKRDLFEFIRIAKKEGKTVAALGASTKGNVLLQYCGLTSDDISYIGEVNPDKFGCYTPGSWIPIIPEDEALAKNPDYLIVLPWHFKKFFMNDPKYFNRNLVFPLPKLSVERYS